MPTVQPSHDLSIVPVLIGAVVGLLGTYSTFVINTLRDKHKELIEDFRAHRAEQITTMADIFERMGHVEKCSEKAQEAIEWVKTEHRKNHP